MSDDMGEKIKQIADMLGQNSNPNIPDNVKGLLSMLMSNDSKEKDSSEEDSSEEQSQKSRSSNNSSSNETDEFADMARKMKKAMGKLGTGSDPRVNLLNAIRPYLNKSRQRKLQNCIKLMRLGSLTQILDDSEDRPV
ncbi:hypothetical protein CLHUN_07890 [Ruminiclostridium hungatei]|uniref:Uncharacterized protein n=1 Tax=Ruminiclostridium hungatei TaxID=48256 RepID=A0A1V4SNF3_RUMHU|nr:hypothetical protein [Ruminiclostridium hungatei]OPX45419.1 hypothetical protein CLHUN_07890 [Ruminiclostridium hungatei]